MGEEVPRGPLLVADRVGVQEGGTYLRASAVARINMHQRRPCLPVSYCPGACYDGCTCASVCRAGLTLGRDGGYTADGGAAAATWAGGCDVHAAPRVHKSRFVEELERQQRRWQAREHDEGEHVHVAPL